MDEIIKVGNIEAEAGTKRTGYLKIRDLNGYGLEIPVMVITGSKKGSTLCVTAGVHPMEYTGIETAMRLYAQLNPKELSGAVIVIPIVNVPGFQARTAYVNPIDGLNMNRIFPGDSKGSISYIMADALFKEVVMKSNFIIDLHGGDSPEENLDFVIVEKTGKKEVDKVSEQIGRAFNAEYMWIKGAVPGGLKIEGALCSAANAAGIPGAVPEAGMSAKVQESCVKFLLDGIVNAMKCLRMIEGTPKIKEAKIIKAQHVVKAQSAGFFTPTKKLGDIVSKGDIIARIRNPFGEVVEEVKSPVHGVFDFLMFHASVMPGNGLMIIGEL
jgi:predicted deacylase